jgi:choline dehydrogenase-like flavoprotein
MGGARFEAEYVVVGSGAGGGTVAARLAEEGRTVLVLEAGCDALATGADRLPCDYEVPAFHGFASENPALKWDFFVRHYADDDVQRQDLNYRKQYVDGKLVDGVLYPRAGTLGGCTSHNGMIFVYPHNADWQHIADLTKDRSWRPDAMRRYFERLENCGHRGWLRPLAALGINPSRHGWKGWLRTERALPPRVMLDAKLAATLLRAAYEEFAHEGRRLKRLDWFFEGRMDPNDWRLVRENAVGLRYTPMTTRGHQRTGTRERLLDVARRYPKRLRIETDALATRVLFDERNRAVGVEYLAGARLYRAHAYPSDAPGEPRTVRASREVILAGGAFNTPQLLMLSGIGPRETLRRWNIPPRSALEGVGANLQDRYEFGVVTEMAKPWDAYAGATFGPGDPQYAQWEHSPRGGMYTSNGVALTAHRRSPVAGGVPDLFCMALLANFRGYHPGYSERLRTDLNYLTWVVLKGHTRNRSGTVTLRSADPRDTPEVNFHSFQEGGDEDVAAMVDGVEFVRKLAAPHARDGAREVWPGPDVRGEELASVIRRDAWGHHASCSAPIGEPERGGVLDGDFRVHGVEGLRVVDASVFPRIPGFFIAAPIYMIAEKAADAILAHARRRSPRRGPLHELGSYGNMSVPAGDFRKDEGTMALDSAQLLTMSSQQLDDLFAGSDSGPVPNGPAKGTAIIAPGTTYSADIAELVNLFAWQGKTFDGPRGVLTNRISVLGFNAIVAEVYVGESWFDHKPCIVLDYSKTSFVAKRVRDEIRLVAPGLYLGLVYWGDKRLIHFSLQFEST